LAGLAIGAALFFGGCATGHHYGASDVQAQWDKAKIAQQQAVVKQDTKVQAATATQASDAAAQGVQIVHDTQVVYEKGKTITVKVPVYITKHDDVDCTINAGFVRLWNASNGAPGSELPTSTDSGQQSDHEASGAVIPQSASARDDGQQRGSDDGNTKSGGGAAQQGSDVHASAGDSVERVD
jgi:hypothetical protein